MTNTFTVKVGVMPGRIEEYAFEQGTTVAQALQQVGLSADGYEIKADGATVSEDAVISTSTNVILLTKKVKGNNTVKIGVMPGRIEEFALETSTTVAGALAQANLSADGYEVKADGSTVTDLNQPIGSANVILLTKKVKGNHSVKIGVMPGRIEEYALETSTTVADALAFANLSSDGYEVKADGSTVTDLNQPIGTVNVILLTKKVKGNTPAHFDYDVELEALGDE
jgi:sulfur carrier protein ThiS